MYLKNLNENIIICLSAWEIQKFSKVPVSNVQK